MSTFRRCLAVLVAVMLAASCQSDSKEGKGSMRTMAVADASRTADAYLHDVLAVIGSEAQPVTRRSGKPSPCEGRDGRFSGKDKYSILNIFNLAVAPKDQVATLTRVKDHLVTRGFTVDRFGVTDMEGNPGGTVETTNPQDGFQVYVITASPPDQVAIWISSPCYATPDSQPPWTAAVTAGPTATPN